MEVQSEDNLNRLLEVTRSLDQLYNDILEVVKVLKHVLENDEDLAAMYLTYNATTGTERAREEHEEVEILLENYLQRYEEILNSANELQMYVNSTEDWLRIRIDSHRNKLIHITLLFTMGTFSVGSSTLISSAFGMNLLSGFEHHPLFFCKTHLFHFVCESVLTPFLKFYFTDFVSAFTTFFSFGSFGMFYVFMRRKGIL